MPPPRCLRRAIINCFSPPCLRRFVNSSIYNDDDADNDDDRHGETASPTLGGVP